MSKSAKTALVSFFLSRFVVGLFTYLGHGQRSLQADLPGRWGGVANWWLNPWTTYDSEYYLRIARQGYDAVTSTFFPLFPILLKLGGGSEIGMAVVGVVISNICFLAALYVLYKLTEIDYGEKTATASVWLLAFFPTTAFFSAVYTESLFLLLLLLSLYAARRRGWLIAGLLGFLAALTRNPGVLIFAALGLEYLHANEFSWKRLELPHLFFVSLPLVAFIGVQAHLWNTLGIPLAGVASQQRFYRGPAFPWEPIGKDLLGFFTFLDFDLLTFVNLGFLALAFFLAIRYRRDLRPAHAVLLFGVILMNLTYAQKIPPHTTATVRYLSTAFPFVQLLGLDLARPASWSGKHRLALGGIYLYTCLLFSFLFGLKSFLG